MAFSWISITALLCGLAMVGLTSAEMCSTQAVDSIPAIQKMGRFGQGFEITGEVQSPLSLSRWKRKILGSDNSIVNLALVTRNSNNQTIWKEEAPDRYAVRFRTEGAKSFFTFNFLKLSCYERGEYTCEFIKSNGADCVTKFNVNITADPLAPWLKNDTIRGDVGSTVQVMCEGNVGYPAGDLWWYFYPADGSNAYRIQSSPAELSSANDCRFYARSTINVQLKATENLSKIRCTSRSYSGQESDHSESQIIINGMEPPTTPHGGSSGKPCEGNDCASTGAVDIKASLLTPILSTFLLVINWYRLQHCS